jgi:hypothetical protein
VALIGQSLACSSARSPPGFGTRSHVRMPEQVQDVVMEPARAGFYAEMEGSVFGRLLDFLNRLDQAHISYQLRNTRPDSVMIDISLPGWRWEVEFMADGSIDIERYRSVAGVENDPGLLETLFEDADPR